MLVLGAQDVERLLPMPRCIELMSQALASLARGEVMLPLRQVLRLPDTPNVFALMPAHASAPPALGAKIISVFPANHASGRHSHQGIVVLFGTEHGEVQAVLDAASITAIRTAAVSGVATRHMARQNASTVAVIGAGVQGRTHIAAMLAARPFARVLVWSRSAEHARSLAMSAARAAPAGVAIEAIGSAEDAVRAADVVCTVTAAREPVVRGEWIRPGTHVNAVGASIPSSRELDTAAVRMARLVVDRRESALAESGDVLIPIAEGAITADHIRAELGEVVIGSAAGRTSEDDVTVFKSLGLAVEDLACARFLHDEARRTGAGTWIDL